MFDSEIISQDSFLDLPMEAKALYFLLGMEADDEGFVSPKKVIRLYGGTEDSIKILVIKNYIIPFNTGVVVITDWKNNNWIDKRRIKPTIYQEEQSQLLVNDITGRYELIEPSNINCLATAKQTLSNGLASAEHLLRENSIEENSTNTNNTTNNNFINNNIINNSINSSSNNNDINNINYNINNNILYNTEAEKLQEIMIETIGTTNINNIKECIDYLDKLPIELIEYALRKTARIKNPSWQYTIPILESYIDKGFKTIKEVEADYLEYKSNSKKETSQETEEEKQKRRTKELEDYINGNK